MVDVEVEREIGECDPNQNAREALARYRDTDPSVPLGGMPINEYERLRLMSAEAEAATLNPREIEELGWLHMEHGIAAFRGAIKPETEAPYTPKEITAMMEAARQAFARAAKHPEATVEDATRARWAGASIPLQEEIVNRKTHRAGISNRHLPHLRSLHQIGRHLLASGELSPEGATLAYAITTQLSLSEGVGELGWFLPAAPRQPWHVTAHNADRRLPDQFLLIAEEGPEEYTLIPPFMLQAATESESPQALLDGALQLDPGYTLRGYRKVLKGEDAVKRYQDLMQKYKGLTETLIARLNVQKEWQQEHGIMATDEIAMRTSVEESVEREIYPEALWYIAQYTDETPLEELRHNVAALETRRTAEGLYPDEQRILAWMQLEQAVRLAKVAGKDAKQLEIARNRFAAAIDTFTRAAKSFERAGELGDMVDVLVALESIPAYRALYTSTDKYAVRKAVAGYPQKVAELFGVIAQHSANIKGDDYQFETLLEVLTRAATCLLQSAASDETGRHLVLPAPNRVSSPNLTAYVIDCTERVPTYDTEQPVGIVLTAGAEIKAKPNRVQLGRERLSDDPLALLQELAAALGVDANPSKSAKSKKGKAKPAAVAPVVTRSAAVDELSQELGDKIFDASEGLDDDVED